MDSKKDTNNPNYAADVDTASSDETVIAAGTEVDYETEENVLYDIEPQKESIQNKEINIKRDLFYPYLNKNDAQLCHNGCYHFKLKYNPNAHLSSEFKIGNLRVNDNLSEIFKNSVADIAESVENTFVKSSDTMQYAFGSYTTNLVNLKKMEAFQKKVADSVVDNLLRSGGIAPNIFNDDSVDKWNKEHNVQKEMYDDKFCYIANVFLPLNSLNIHRESGISESDQIYTGDWKTNQMIETTQKAIKQKDMDTITKKAGYGEGRYKGYTMNGYDFETYNLEWDLMPRNWEEMNQILQILTVFQCSCISNIDLNDKSNLYWAVPPECEMEIIVTSSDVNNGTRISEWKLTEDTTFFKNVAGEKLKVNYLKKMKIYVKNVEIAPISNNGGVLLSDEGFPMGVKLKVTIMRSELVNINTLKKEGSNTSGAMSYNPFA